jgi:gluconokinase
MCGWLHLPRFIDKIRLHHAGRLHPDYHQNFTRGFDGRWLEAAGLSAAAFIDVVSSSLTDGQVCDWVRRNVRRTDAEKAAFNQFVLHRGTEDDEVRARLQSRKRESGLADRADIRTFVDLIEADEGRL